MTIFLRTALLDPRNAIDILCYGPVMPCCLIDMAPEDHDWIHGGDPDAPWPNEEEWDA